MNEKIRHFGRGECRQVDGLLDDFLSNELTIETNRQILSHLESCVYCEEERQRRYKLKSALESSWNSLTSPPTLKNRIEHEVLHSSRLAKFPFRLAAAFVISLLGVALYLTFTGQQPPTDANFQVVDHYRFAVQDHLRCTGRPAQSQNLPLDSHFSQIRTVMGQTSPRYQFVGVMECDLGESTYTHYVFRNSEDLLSVMIEEHESNQTLPERGNKLKLANLNLQTVMQGPVALASFETDKHFVYLIGDGFSSQQTADFAEKIAPALNRALLSVS